MFKLKFKYTEKMIGLLTRISAAMEVPKREAQARATYYVMM